MKKILAILCLLLASSVFAYDDNYWPKSYFLSAGYGIGATFGDLNDHTLSATDSLGNKEIVYPPDMSLLLHPDFAIGANIRDFSLAMTFQYQSMEQALTKGPEDSDDVKSRIWRFGFEFTYNLFWPDPLQFGFGMGYSFTNLKTKSSAVYDNKWKASEIMGSAISVIINSHYYFNDYLALVPSVKFYETWFKSVYTERSETCDLKNYLWQTFIVANLSLQFQF